MILCPVRFVLCAVLLKSSRLGINIMPSVRGLLFTTNLGFAVYNAAVNRGMGCTARNEEKRHW